MSLNSHFSLWRVAGMVLAMVWLPMGEFVRSPVVFAEEAPVLESEEAKAEEPVDAQTVEKRRRAMAGLMAVSGILILGVMFLAVVLIWGARLRRLARRELPAQTTLQNDLWFLKPPKPAAGEGDSETPEAS